MTEVNKNNIKSYLELCEKVYDMNEKSMDYLKHRLSDDWTPVKEYQELINNSLKKGAIYEDQRLRFDIDLGLSSISDIFKDTDQSYKMFRHSFAAALSYLEDEENVEITYKDFLSNKVKYNKNITKIKKVLEQVYKKENYLFREDFSRSYSEEGCAAAIIKAYERIGASKKSDKKLQLVISFNPMDWLLSSTKENFSSCFNIDNSSGGYHYSLGLPFLAGDKNRVMIYISTGLKKEHLGITVDSVQARTWGILGVNKKVAIVKWYPNVIVDNVALSQITNSNIFVGKNSFSESLYSYDSLFTKKGIFLGVYSDMGRLKVDSNNEIKLYGNGKEGFQWFSDNGIDLSREASGRHSFDVQRDIGAFFGISAGYVISKWKKYGLHLDNYFTTCYCKKCGKDKVGFFVRENFYCKDCYKDAFYTCGLCGERHELEEDTKKLVDSNNKTVYICENCSGSISNYTCSCCGVFDRNLQPANKGNEHICKSCKEKEGYDYCERCGNLYKDFTYFYNTYNNTSKSCCDDCKDSVYKDLLGVAKSVNTFNRSFKILARRGRSID